MDCDSKGKKGLRKIIWKGLLIENNIEEERRRVNGSYDFSHRTKHNSLKANHFTHKFCEIIRCRVGSGLPLPKNEYTKDPCRQTSGLNQVFLEKPHNNYYILIIIFESWKCKDWISNITWQQKEGRKCQQMQTNDIYILCLGRTNGPAARGCYLTDGTH